MVVGIGSTELIAAALYALSPTQDEATASVWSRAPYYSGYKQSATFFRSAGFEWAADNASSPPPATAERPLIELVTSPNNPDGHARAASVAGPHSSAVMDHAYLWPHFTAVGPPVAYGNSTATASSPDPDPTSLARASGVPLLLRQPAPRTSPSFAPHLTRSPSSRSRR